MHLQARKAIKAVHPEHLTDEDVGRLLTQGFNVGDVMEGQTLHAVLHAAIAHFDACSNTPKPVGVRFWQLWDALKVSRRTHIHTHTHTYTSRAPKSHAYRLQGHA